jgi:vacuolar-type H+-ATPase subunit E/Vma4
MPLETILRALEVEAERQVADVQHSAQVEVEKIRATAQIEATKVRQRRVTAVQPSLKIEKARILNKARLEALQLVMGTREDLMTAALDRTALRLAALSTHTTYGGFLRQLAQEALERLGSLSELRLCVHRRDMELMQCLAREMGLSATVVGGLEREVSPWGCLGGLVVSTVDERISLANTLAVRLQRVATLYRSQIAEMVCGS